MILILSNNGDLSCDLVQDWLDFYNQPYLRINSFDLMDNEVDFSLNSDGIVSIRINNELIDLNAINAVWFRKYGFFRCSEAYEHLCVTKMLSESMINHLIKEFAKVSEILILSLQRCNWITNPQYININKFHVLKIAKDCGFNISETYITNCKSVLSTLNNCISKSILDPIISGWGDGNSCMMYTTEVGSSDILNSPDNFLPSMLQKKIEKIFEFRIFYLCGEMYSMAIFSQCDDKTKLDFRDYNWIKPNRAIPCNLDEEIKLKIKKLMDKLNLNCGSIDLIKSTDGKIYFLEVNPTGQFGMVDFPCNYGLHKKVAEKLIEMDKKNNYERKII